MTDTGAQLVTVLRTPSGAPAGERVIAIASPEATTQPVCEGAAKWPVLH